MISTKNYVLLLTNLHIAYSNRATVVVDAPAVLLDAVDALSVCADIVDVHHQYTVAGINVDVVHIVSWTASVRSRSASPRRVPARPRRSPRATTSRACTSCSPPSALPTPPATAWSSSCRVRSAKSCLRTGSARRTGSKAYSLPRMPSVTNIKKHLTPVKGRYFSDNKKTARSLHRLRAATLTSKQSLH